MAHQEAHDGDDPVGVGLVAVVAMAVSWSGGAMAGPGPTPAQHCQATKNKAAGAKATCLAKGHAATAEGKTFNFAQCETNFTNAFASAERKAEPGVCPTEGDAAAIEAQVDAAAANLAAALSGSTPPATHQFPATGQTTCWITAGAVIPCAVTGQDGDIQAGATLSYTDNGDGTITDNNTGLMWEKKSFDGSIHHMGTFYSWDDAFAVHIAGLNTMNAGAGFAGYTDWRLPNIKELQSIVNYENILPAVSPAFNTGCVAGCTVTTCSCTGPSFYWSSSSSSSTGAWRVFFTGGAPSSRTSRAPLRRCEQCGAACNRPFGPLSIGFFAGGRES